MNIIIPLAGPDFISASGELKSLIKYNRDYLTRYIVKSRPWMKSTEKNNLIFILDNSKITAEFSDNYLLKWFPNSKVIYISDYTRGAALTSLTACGY